MLTQSLYPDFISNKNSSEYKSMLNFLCFVMDPKNIKYENIFFRERVLFYKIKEIYDAIMNCSEQTRDNLKNELSLFITDLQKISIDNNLKGEEVEARCSFMLGEQRFLMEVEEVEDYLKEGLNSIIFRMKEYSNNQGVVLKEKDKIKEEIKEEIKDFEYMLMGEGVSIFNFNKELVKKYYALKRSCKL